MVFCASHKFYRYFFLLLFLWKMIWKAGQLTQKMKVLTMQGKDLNLIPYLTRDGEKHSWNCLLDLYTCGSYTYMYISMYIPLITNKRILRFCQRLHYIYRFLSQVWTFYYYYFIPSKDSSMLGKAFTSVLHPQSSTQTGPYSFIWAGLKFTLLTR